MTAVTARLTQIARFVKVVGYQPVTGILADDYRDFRIGAEFRWDEAVQMAHDGVFPPGIILQCAGGVPCVIEGDYDHEQTARPLEAG